MVEVAEVVDVRRWCEVGVGRWWFLVERVFVDGKNGA